MSGVSTGTFYSPIEIFALSLLYLPFALFALIKLGRKGIIKHSVITVPFLLSALIILSRLFFYKRMGGFFDLFAVLLAGYGVTEFIKTLKFNKNKFIYPYILISIAFITIFIAKTAKPLILEDELAEIKKLREVEENAYILSTSRVYTSWLYGWSDRTVIAPGFGENDIYWSISEWHEFWDYKDKKRQIELLQKLPSPLYIYLGDRREMSPLTFEGECFERVNFRTYKFLCLK